MRQRLSWDEEKTAEIMKQADPYTMNQQRMNPPAGKYDVGGPSEFAEDQNMATPWKTEGRTETGHPTPAREAREAVVNAKQLEDKALKCITIAQRMLPGADENFVEDQATDLMFLPERAIMATLQRQTELAAKIAAEAEKDEKKEEGEEVEAAKKEEKKPEEKETTPATAAKKEEKKPEEKETTPATAAVKEEEKKEEEKAAAVKEEEEKKEEEKAAAVKEEEEKKEEEKAAAVKKEEKKEEEKATTACPEKKDEGKEAFDKDLLDIIFASEEIVPQSKTGAKTLSGLVKQASTESVLEGLWEAPPDVSSVFGKNR